MANQAKIRTQNMAHLAHSIHFLIQLVILMVGRSCYKENPHPELSRYKDVDRKHKNTTYDQAFENVYLIRKFLVKHSHQRWHVYADLKTDWQYDLPTQNHETQAHGISYRGSP